LFFTECFGGFEGSFSPVKKSQKIKKLKKKTQDGGKKKKITKKPHFREPTAENLR